MKKILLCLFAIFCFSYAYADTVNINWGADNKLYTTTTCDIGTDVILPTPPTKRGHTFRGWKKDSFNRGTWPDWDTVPNIENQYLSDVYGNTTPMANDYMVVEDASGYTGISENILGKTITYYLNKTMGSGWLLTDEVGCITIDLPISFINGKKCIFTTESTFPLYKSKRQVKGNSFWNIFSGTTYCESILIPEDTNAVRITVKKTDGTEATEEDWNKLNCTLKTLSDEGMYEGSWRFSYKGNWTENNKNGWKPEYQITGE